MDNTNIQEVIVQTNSYEIISADTAFYAFIKKRYYYTFDRLVCEEDRAILYRYIEGMLKDSFAIRLLNVQEKEVYFLVQIYPCDVSGCVKLKLIQADGLLDSMKLLNSRMDAQNYILELYNDYYFEYNVAGNRFHVYSRNRLEQTICSVSLEELEERFRGNCAQEETEKLDGFFAALRVGKHDLELDVSGDILNGQIDADITQIRGRAINEDGAYRMAVGYIHYGNVNSLTGGRRKIERDSLTGVLAKGEVTNAAIKAIDVNKSPNTCICIIDVDYFKHVNDNFGHMVGDEVLKKVAAIMETEVDKSGIVGRIGGDEFMIIYHDVYDMEFTREHLEGIKNVVAATFPPNMQNKPAITLSIGCASYPKDAANYEDLFTLADFALYRAKEKGRNRYIIFDEAKHGTLKDIKSMKMSDNRLNNRGNMSIGDIVCALMTKVYSSEEYSLEQFLDDIVVNLGIQRITVYAGTPGKVVAVAGEGRPSQEIIEETQSYITHEALTHRISRKHKIIIVDDIAVFSSMDEELYNKLKKQGIISLLQVPFTDKNGIPGILSFEAVSKKTVWNRNAVDYYKLLARLFAEYTL
ncbi:MAG: GGDEF domain-containing protein [Bacteroidales bacterium]|nr:GGDEF domain-containing protein [Lachnoclostridium sp.]MCM1383736.1 GGDEF domain-containing protein [Lachnoclostridium sp.]MCM1464364.1 GGDEF domain-containing protein [Bacteroidales bacterium]